MNRLAIIAKDISEGLDVLGNTTPSTEGGEVRRLGSYFLRRFKHANVCQYRAGGPRLSIQHRIKKELEFRDIWIISGYYLGLKEIQNICTLGKPGENIQEP